MMKVRDTERKLSKIIPKMSEQKFIDGRGLGNEISFYVFDYDARDELLVRDYVKLIKKKFGHEGSNRRIIEIDLYKMLIEIAKERKIFDRIFEMEEKQGKDALFQAMTTFAKPDVFLNKIKEEIKGYDVMLITGVGKVYPFIRSHTILNNLQDVVDKMPVVMFFPGEYDGQSLQLFGKFKDDNYYRAFRLVD